MKIIDEPLLQTFREKQKCEWCMKEFRTGLDPAHIVAKGMGGGRRLDHRLNLVALDRKCHQAHHATGKPSAADLFAVVARREGYASGEVVEEEVWKMIRAPKPREE